MAKNKMTAQQREAKAKTDKAYRERIAAEKAAAENNASQPKVQKPISAPMSRILVTMKAGNSTFVNWEIAKVYKGKMAKPGYRGPIVKVEEF